MTEKIYKHTNKNLSIILKLLKRYLIDKVKLTHEDFYNFLTDNKFFEVNYQYEIEKYIFNSISNFKTEEFFFRKIKEDFLDVLGFYEFHIIPVIYERFNLVMKLYRLIFKYLNESEKTIPILEIVLERTDGTEQIIHIDDEKEIDIDKNINFKEEELSILYIYFLNKLKKEKYYKSNNLVITFKFEIDELYYYDDVFIMEIYNNFSMITFNNLSTENTYLLNTIYKHYYKRFKNELHEAIKIAIEEKVKSEKSLELYLKFKQINFDNKKVIKYVLNWMNQRPNYSFKISEKEFKNFLDSLIKVEGGV